MQLKEVPSISSPSESEFYPKWEVSRAGRGYFFDLVEFGDGEGLEDLPASLSLLVTCLKVLPMAGPIFGISSSMFFAALFKPRPISSSVTPWLDPALPLPEASDAAFAVSV